tara:strand:- start:785 stop:1264 length:480 start_codon:yes stop_codon:yes gene_type:complete
MSCSNDIKKNDLKGNWSLIENDSIYFEVKIDSSNLLYYNYDYSFLPLRSYYVKNDSIYFQFSKNDVKKNVYRIDFQDVKRVFLKNDNNEIIIKLFKIDSTEFTFDKIINLDDERFKFEVAHLNRKNKLLGLDYYYDLDSITKVFEEMKIPDVEELDISD